MKMEQNRHGSSFGMADRGRLNVQRSLLKARTNRHTPIQVTPDGVIYDGHHAVRAAADQGVAVEVLVVNDQIPATAASILDLKAY